MDKRKFNGGNKNAGRKAKDHERKVVEVLEPFHSDAVEQLQLAVKAGKDWAIKLYFEYYYGKPRQSIDHTTGGEPMPCPVIVFPKDEQV